MITMIRKKRLVHSVVRVHRIKVAQLLHTDITRASYVLKIRCEDDHFFIKITESENHFSEGCDHFYQQK